MDELRKVSSSRSENNAWLPVDHAPKLNVRNVSSSSSQLGDLGSKKMSSKNKSFGAGRKLSSRAEMLSMGRSLMKYVAVNSESKYSHQSNFDRQTSIQLGESRLQDVFEMADMDNDGRLIREDTYTLVAQLGIESSQRELDTAFDTFDEEKCNSLNMVQFSNFLFLLLANLFSMLKTGGYFQKCRLRFGWTRKVFLQLDESSRFLRIQYIHPLAPFITGRCRILDLETVIRVEQGQVTNGFTARHKALKAQSFSILLHAEAGIEKAINFLAPSEEVQRAWCKRIELLLRWVKLQVQSTSVATRYLKFMFELADVQKLGGVTLYDILDLVEMMSINISEKAASDAFAQVDVDDVGELDLTQFGEFIALIRKNEDLVLLWNAIVDGTWRDLANDVQRPEKRSFMIPSESVITYGQLDEFWEEVQGGKLKESVGNGDVLRLFSDGFIGFKDFCALMTSEENFIVDPHSQRLVQDMTQPLSHYFINSSHNTYLEGDQLTSKSSVKRYIDDLLQGIRSVELDTWDGPDGDPIITHGHTLTTAISLRDVAEAIIKYAFLTSPFPIILSVENHCGPQQQRLMVDIFKDTFGDHLLLPEGSYSESFVPLLSPDALRGKILIKGVRTKDKIIEDAEHAGEDEDEDEAEEVESKELSPVSSKLDFSQSEGSYSPWRSEPPKRRGSKADSPTRRASRTSSPKRRVSRMDSPKRRGSRADRSCSPAAANDGTLKRSESPSRRSSHRPALNRFTSVIEPVKTDIALSSLAYLSKHKVKKFDNRILADHTGSYKETRMTTMLKDDMTTAHWMHFNRLHISRIYPDGIKRIDSSNYNPLIGWAGGAQMAALNMQSPGVPLMLNQGMFRGNGGCGYILKPGFMLDSALFRQAAIDLKINIISGQNLPKDPELVDLLCPCIEVTVHDLDVEYKVCQTSVRTSAVRDNGFDPLWNEVFGFHIRYPELAQLSFRCFHENYITAEYDFVASASYRISDLRQGFRIVQLYDLQGKKEMKYAFASLFVQLSLKESPIRMNSVVDIRVLSDNEAAI